MPYFIDGEQCVRKGTKENPGDVVKCHKTHEEAVAHLRALYVNVEDAKAIEGKEHVWMGTIEPEVAEKFVESIKASMVAPTANYIHGQGGVLSATRGGYTCKCDCGHEYQSNEPCSESKCPKCKEKDMNEPLSKFTIYKSHDGTYRWETVSNVAIMDREGETISEKAYDDGIRYATETGEYGELDLVHVDGTEIGKCDRMKRLGQYLIEEGYLYDTERSKRVCGIIQSNPTHWGVSIKFVYDPEQFVDNTYQGGIRILKRSVLPRHMAASHGTAIAVAGGAEMAKSVDEEQKAALEELGETEESIAELAEKNKALPADEENVVEKESTETSGFMTDIKSAVWGALKEVAENMAVGKSEESPEPVAPDTTGEETAKNAETEVESEKAEVQDDEQEKQTEQEEPTAEEQEKATGEEADGTSETITPETLKSFGTEMTKLFAQELAKVKLELEKEKAQREKVTEALSETNKRLAELAKPIEERVMDWIEQQPAVNKVRVSHIEATAKPSIAVSEKTQTESPVSKLMGDIVTEVKRKQKGGGDDKYEV